MEVEQRLNLTVPNSVGIKTSTDLYFSLSWFWSWSGLCTRSMGLPFLCLGGISSSVLSLFFTDKFALSQSDARISVAYNSCQWKTLTKRLMKCPPGLDLGTSGLEPNTGTKLSKVHLLENKIEQNRKLNNWHKWNNLWNMFPDMCTVFTLLLTMP